MAKTPKTRVKSRTKLTVGTGETPDTVLFRGRKYWRVVNAFTLGGAKKEARKLLKRGYKVRLIDVADDIWISVYVRPNPFKPTKLS